MRNKIQGIKYFICFAVLIFVGMRAYPSGSIQDKEFSSISTIAIENIFKQKLEMQQGILYTHVPQGLVVSFTLDKFFSDEVADLSDNSKILLHQIAEVLKILNKECIIECGVETNIKTNGLANWELSTIQAQKIADFMIKKEKIHPLKISAIGFGEFLPFTGNTNHNQNLSNRIDFVIINYEIPKR